MCDNLLLMTVSKAKLCLTNVKQHLSIVDYVSSFKELHAQCSMKTPWSMVMIGYVLDRGGPKDSETAPDSFLTKPNGKGF